MAKLMEFIDLPPVWLVACIAGAWILAENAPIVMLAHPALTVIGWALVAAGIGLGIYAVISFWRFKTSVIPRQTPSALIDDGPFRFSRNPIYLADVIILAGFVVLFGGLSAIITLPLFWWIIERRFILSEEVVLKASFGADYDAYCQAVRRWI
ncbi:MAG: isoprenylcysteine carboxylmethyltransferase family protein [Pseudomonadota bacterium]